MKCPKCENDHIKYVDDRNNKYYGSNPKKEKRNTAKMRHIKSVTRKHDKIKPRENFGAKCKKCGWSGVL